MNDIQIDIDIVPVQYYGLYHEQNNLIYNYINYTYHIEHRWISLIIESYGYRKTQVYASKYLPQIINYHTIEV